MDTNTTTTPDWRLLPKDLLLTIVNRLNSGVDTLRLRAVCRPFRSSIPPPPKTTIPTSNLKIPFTFCNKRGQLLLTEATVYAIEPLNKISNTHNTTKTWLLKVQESNSGIIRVKDPLSKHAFDNLSGRLPQTLNLLDYRVKEISKAFAIELFSLGDCDQFEEGLSLFFEKAVVSTRRNDNNAVEYSIMALITGGLVGVFRSEVKMWSHIDFGGDAFYFEDIVYHKHRFYALGLGGLTITVDCKSLHITEVAAPVLDRDRGLKYLVKSFDDLLFIEQHWVDEYCDYCEAGLDREDCGHPVHFNVFKLDEEKHTWVSVRNNELEDRVFFVGDDCTFSVSAKEFSGCKGNCVYFADDVFARIRGHNHHPGSDAGIYELEDDFAGPLSAFPYYTNIFWPPPSWLRQNPRLARS